MTVVKQLILIFYMFQSSYGEIARPWAQLQEKISASINLALRVGNASSLPHFPHSQIQPIAPLCSTTISEKDQPIGCCLPTDVRHLYNVMIRNSKFFVFSNLDSEQSGDINIPPVVSVQMQQKRPFSMGVEIVHEPFPSAKCSSFFNGTLHVIGRSTAHNVYHAG